MERAAGAAAGGTAQRGANPSSVDRFAALRDNTDADELALRKAALQTLWKELHPDARQRVKVFDLWNGYYKAGIYVHAKVQTYDDKLLVCGSANMNRRSFECDAELDCAVLHQPTVRTHLVALYACVMATTPFYYDSTGTPQAGRSWYKFNKGWLAEYWGEMRAFGTDTPMGLIDDPFFKENPGKPKTPNGVDMPSTRSSKPDAIFEPSSICGVLGGTISEVKIEDSVCKFACPGDPKAPGRLDELTFLIERCHQGTEWPWREPTARWLFGP